MHAVEHRTEVAQVSLSRGVLGERRLALLDKNKDLYLSAQTSQYFTITFTYNSQLELGRFDSETKGNSQ